jgi:hypothetical protein
MLARVKSVYYLVLLLAFSFRINAGCKFVHYHSSFSGFAIGQVFGGLSHCRWRGCSLRCWFCAVRTLEGVVLRLGRVEYNGQHLAAS